MKKHILFIIENAPVPVDRRVWLEALALKKWGHDVSIISPMGKKETQSFEILEGIEIFRHPSKRASGGKFSYLVEYFSALFWEIIIAIKIYIKNPFQIIHGGNPPDTIFVIALLFKFKGVKFIYDVHDLCPELYLSRYEGKKNNLYQILSLAERLSCKAADVIIATNQSYLDILKSRNDLSSKKSYIVRNDPLLSNVNKTHKNNNIIKDNNSKCILYLGAINPQDGVNILLHILKFLIFELNEKNIICIIIGDGSSLESVKEEAKQLNLLEYIEFKGFIYDKKEISLYLQNADVCVETAPYSEINNNSTFIKIMEYMAAGKPIVAFDLKETKFSAGKAAILISPGDIENFAKAIKVLLNDLKLNEELGMIGQDRIINALNWDNSLIHLKDAYKSLLS